MKKIIHNWAIRQLCSEHGLESRAVDCEKRTINFGFYSLGKMFFRPKHELMVAILVKWFGYRCMEERMHHTWCDGGKSLGESYDRWNTEWEKMLDKNMKKKQ